MRRHHLPSTWNACSPGRKSPLSRTPALFRNVRGFRATADPEPMTLLKCLPVVSNRYVYRRMPAVQGAGPANEMTVEIKERE